MTQQPTNTFQSASKRGILSATRVSAKVPGSCLIKPPHLACTGTHVHMHPRMRPHPHTHYTHPHEDAHMHARTHVRRARAHMHTRAHTHHTHTHTHTHTHSHVQSHTSPHTHPQPHACMHARTHAGYMRHTKVRPRALLEPKGFCRFGRLCVLALLLHILACFLEGGPSMAASAQRARLASQRCWRDSPPNSPHSCGW